MTKYRDTDTPSPQKQAKAHVFSHTNFHMNSVIVTVASSTCPHLTGALSLFIYLPGREREGRKKGRGGEGEKKRKG